MESLVGSAVVEASRSWVAGIGVIAIAWDRTYGNVATAYDIKGRVAPVPTPDLHNVTRMQAA